MGRKKKQPEGEETTLTITSSEGSVETTMERLQEVAAAYENPVFHQEGGIRILKAKITKEQALEVTYKETLADGSHSEVVKKCDNIAHSDLREVFEKLVPHMVVICEQQGAISVETSHEVLLGYAITGFSVGGDGDSEGVTIVGNKTLDGGRVLNLVSPFTKWEDDYAFSSELGMAMEACIYEVKEYLNGKCAVKQMDMFEKEEGE